MTDPDGKEYTVLEYTFVIQSKARNIVTKEVEGVVSYKTSDGKEVQVEDEQLFLDGVKLEIQEIIL